MNRRVAAILLFLAAACLWLVFRPQGPLPPPSPPAARPAPQESPPPHPQPPSSPQPQPSLSSTAAPPSAPKPRPPNLSPPLVPSTIPGESPPGHADIDAPTGIDFDKISAMLRDYRTLFGENPVGTNAEIMKSIMGGNPKGAMLGPPEGQSLNENGELLDRWGSPLFFHQLAADQMELRSAGPDRTLWNADDLVR